MAKKLARVSIPDETTSSYTIAAYLITQLRKNYSLPHEKRIGGSILLDSALETINEMKYSIGDVMEFLECEDNKRFPICCVLPTERFPPNPPNSAATPKKAPFP